MSGLVLESEDLLALGAFVGAQVLVLCMSMVIANAYRERPLLLHGAASMLAVLAVQTLAGTQPFYPEVVLLLLLALAGMQLYDLVGHVGAARRPRRWLAGICLGLLPALAVGSAFGPFLLLPGLAAWSAAVFVVLLRAWQQSRPWIWWLVPGFLAMAGAGIALAIRTMGYSAQVLLPVAGLLSIWTVCTFLASTWRGRIFGETRVRVAARKTIDPLTGLATPLVLSERIEASRNLVRRFGHSSVLLLVHIENLDRIAREFGPEAAETTVLAGANRVRQALQEGDVAARLSHSRFGVLAEGLASSQDATDVAGRIIVAGLKEPVPSIPAEFLHFRIVMSPMPLDDIPVKSLLQRMSTRLDHELAAPSERHIIALSSEELLA